ncbi:hypothetical protein ABW19_dt0204714 [Dactylella cylindrospora]|nr:hypothetical protein ABW19_dt0204714 [Dactylella cylindrospora]
MPMKWTLEADRSLLLAILAANENSNYDYAKIGKFAGVEKGQVTWRFHILRKEVKAMRAGAGAGTTTPSKKRSSPSSTESSPKKRKVGRRVRILEDTSEEEPMTPRMEDEDDHEETPELEDDDAEDSPPAMGPATPTKVLPRRKARLQPGAYKKLDGESESEYNEE